MEQKNSFLQNKTVRTTIGKHKSIKAKMLLMPQGNYLSVDILRSNDKHTTGTEIKDVKLSSAYEIYTYKANTIDGEGVTITLSVPIVCKEQQIV